jgi:hypothetical protein
MAPDPAPGLGPKLPSNTPLAYKLRAPGRRRQLPDPDPGIGRAGVVADRNRSRGPRAPLPAAPEVRKRTNSGASIRGIERLYWMSYGRARASSSAPTRVSMLLTNVMRTWRKRLSFPTVMSLDQSVGSWGLAPPPIWLP